MNLDDVSRQSMEIRAVTMNLKKRSMEASGLWKKMRRISCRQRSVNASGGSRYWRSAADTASKIA